MREWHRPLGVLAVLMAVLAVVSVVGLIVDPRVLVGAPIWAKPLKFSVSLALYGATLAVLVPLVREPRPARWARLGANLVVLTSGIEMACIVGQTVRARTSHFDVATAFDTAVWATMGTSIVILWLATAVIGAVLVRERSLSPAMHRAVVLGVGVALIGMAMAFFMTGPTGAQIAAAPTTGMPTIGAHTVGVPDGGPGLTLLGWSTIGGDLRIGHFFGLHGLQALPLLALVLGVLAARVPALRPERVRVRLITVGAAGWTGLTLLLTGQALRGQPLIAPDGLTLLVLAVLVVAVVVATVVAVRSAPAPARATDLAAPDPART